MLFTFAPAKINLYLHVTGRREDGYHLLDSLVAFAQVGDSLCLEEAESLDFKIEGPFADGLKDEEPEKNLVVRAARALGAAVGKEPNGRLILTKNLPVASGIGGGSTDAAASLRLWAEHWGLRADDPRLPSLAAKLGQDVPCCLKAETCYFRGIGDVTDPGPPLPLTGLVLVNPNKALPTPAVFKARQGPFTSAAPLERPPRDARGLAFLLASRENSLTEAALSLCPDIQEVLTALAAQPDCLLARMSGSGATCFGLFPDSASAQQAATRLAQTRPDWWLTASFLPAPSPLFQKK